MVYECEQCGTALPASVLSCPKCGEGFDEAVPQDAEMPVRGWQPKSEASVFSPPTSQSEAKTPATPKIVILQEHHPEPPAMNMPTSGSKSQRGPSPFLAQSTPTASKPKGKKISPWLVFWAIMFLPITLLYLIGLAIVKIWKHPTWSVRTKSILTVLVAAAAITMPINSIVQSVRDQQTAMANQANYVAQQIAEQKKLAELEATPQGRAKLAAERRQQQLVAAKEAHQRDLAALRSGEEAGAKLAKSDEAKAEIVQPSKLVNVGAIFGKSYREVNRIIGGKPYDTENHAPGDVYGFPNGATERDYGSDGHVPVSPGVILFAINFDTDGKAKEFQVISAGPIRNYTLSDWNALLTALGLPNQPEPDSPGLSGMTWNSPAPYHIVMGAMDASNSRQVSLLEIMPREVQDRGESQP